MLRHSPPEIAPAIRRATTGSGTLAASRAVFFSAGFGCSFVSITAGGASIAVLSGLRGVAAS